MNEQPLPQSNPQSQPVVPTPPPNNNSNLLIGIFLLFLGILVGLAIDKTAILSNIRIPYLGVKPTPTPLATPTPTPTANWKTYRNNFYSFQIAYPSRFEIVEKTKREDYYDTLATLTSPFKESITLKAIHDIDIYEKNGPEIVAEREIMDSGFIYNITPTKIGNYFAAITTLDNNPDKKSPTITIAHQNKNLFIVIDINADLSRVEFDQILSTFRFLDEPTTTPVAKYSCPANGWVDCIPGPDAKPECSIEAMLWYKTNCPNFQGGAL